MTDRATKRRRRKDLANCEFRRDGDGRWKLLRGGELLASGMTKEQMLAVIRGDLTLADIQVSVSGGRKKRP
jgi:hypothetical protein